MSKIKKIQIAIISGTIFVLMVGFYLSSRLNEYKAEVIPTFPQAPRNLIAKDNESRTQMTLQWQDVANNEEGFKIERTADILRPFEEIATLPPNTSSYTDSANFIPGQRYYYRVKAYNKRGSSEYSNVGTPTRTENIDFLVGVGDFEEATVSQWTTYDSNSNTYPSFQEWPTENNALATGWTGWCSRLYSDPSLKPGINIITKIEPGVGVNGSNAQYFAIKDFNASSSITVQIGRTIKLSNTYELVEPQDKLVFRLDKVELVDKSNLPPGTSIKRDFYYELNKPGQNQGEVINLGSGTNSLTNDPLELEIPLPFDSVSDLSISLGFRLTFSGDMRGYEGGVRIDGAHLWLKNVNDEHKTWTIPPPRERNILIHANHYALNAMEKSLYWVAKNTDYLTISPGEYYFIPTLKNLNPNLKIFIYAFPWLVDGRYYFPNHTPLYRSSLFLPIDFADALDNHPEWFVPYPPNTRPLSDNRNDKLKYANDGQTLLNYIFSPVYQDEYATNLDAEDYKETWALKTANLIRRFKADGVFSDGPEVQNIEGVDTTTNEPTIVFRQQAYKVQSFSSYAFNYLREQGFATIQNAAGKHYSTWPGESYLNPQWNPYEETAGKNGVPTDFDPSQYQQASRNTTSDWFFNEEAFIRINWSDQNLHDDGSFYFWLYSLIDMDLVEQWNSEDIPPNLKKRIMQNVIYYNREDLNDPAQGLDGSIRFALTSFLLGANEYSSLSIQSGKIDPFFKGNWYNLELDASITQQLGNPVAKRVVSPAYSDQSLQSRKFENGLVVVNGHPYSTRTYTFSEKVKDETGKNYSPGDTIELKPHTGRIFFFQQGEINANMNNNVNTNTNTNVNNNINVNTNNNNNNNNGQGGVPETEIDQGVIKALGRIFKKKTPPVSSDRNTNQAPMNNNQNISPAPEINSNTNTNTSTLNQNTNSTTITEVSSGKKLEPESLRSIGGIVLLIAAFVFSLYMKRL